MDTAIFAGVGGSVGKTAASEVATQPPLQVDFHTNAEVPADKLGSS